MKLKPLMLSGFLLLALILISEIRQVHAPPVEISLTLLEDCEVRNVAGLEDTNYGADIYAHVLNSTTGPKERFSYLKFNLSEIPAGNTIINATLYIYAHSVNPPSGGYSKINVKPVENQTWLEHNITYNYRPPVNNTVLDVSAENTSSSWWDWNLTDYVNEKYTAGSDSNISVAYVNNHRTGAGWFGCYFRSKEHTGSFGSFLNVTYSTPTIDAEPPKYHYPYGLNSTLNGSVCHFQVNFTDNVTLSYAILSWNNSGSWTNHSIILAVGGSPSQNMVGNWYRTLNSTEGVRIEYLFYVNDTSNNWNQTMQHYIYTNTKPVIVVDDAAVLFTGVFVVASMVGCVFILGRRKH